MSIRSLARCTSGDGTLRSSHSKLQPPAHIGGAVLRSTSRWMVVPTYVQEEDGEEVVEGTYAKLLLWEPNGQTKSITGMTLVAHDLITMQLVAVIVVHVYCAAAASTSAAGPCISDDSPTLLLYLSTPAVPTTRQGCIWARKEGQNNYVTRRSSACGQPSGGEDGKYCHDRHYCNFTKSCGA